jgi:uncharacterized protein YdaU (DUF1376 family)
VNFYPRHIGDYLKDTAHLSLLEHGAYGRLLDVYYTREAAIPDSEVYRLVGARSKEDRAAVETVLNEFFDLLDAAWSHKRCDQEIARYHDKQGKAKASAEKRWAHTGRNANASPNAMRTHSEGNAPNNQEPITTSVPNGTGAEAPTDRDLVFANGVALLTAAGVKESNARSFLAAQCKAHGEAAVKAALDRCAHERPVQPVPWLQAALGPANGATKPRRADALMAGNIAAAQRFLEGQT